MVKSNKTEFSVVQSENLENLKEAIFELWKDVSVEGCEKGLFIGNVDLMERVGSAFAY